MFKFKFIKFRALIFFILVLFLLNFTSNAAETWRGPAHLTISIAGTYILSEIPTRIKDDYKIHNLYLFSTTLMLAAGFGKEAVDDIVPGKIFSWEDIGLDLIGITTGVVTHYFLSERRKRKFKPSLSIKKGGINICTTFHF